MSNESVPSFTELMSAPHKQFAAWCQGPMAYKCGDLLAAAAVCRLNDARSIIESLMAEAGGPSDKGGRVSNATAEHVKRFLA